MGIITIVQNLILDMVFYYAKPTWKSRSNPRRPIGAAANKLSAYPNPADIPGTLHYITNFRNSVNSKKIEMFFKNDYLYFLKLYLKKNLTKYSNR
jgi:hypothetical protein